ncbi:hypothetical protein ABTN31_19185 [Acinetobacter baumannii]
MPRNPKCRICPIQGYRACRGSEQWKGLSTTRSR